MSAAGSVVAMLIFAPEATDSGRFEDYARKMYPQYNHLNVPTWIIGPALGEGPLIRRLTAKFEKIIVDVQAASPSSWKTDCMAVRMVS